MASGPASSGFASPGAEDERTRAAAALDSSPTSLHRVVPDRRRQPDPLVVLLQHTLPRDLFLLAHPSVLCLGRAREVRQVEVRRRDQARDCAPATRAVADGWVAQTLPDLVDHPAGLALVLVDWHGVTPRLSSAAPREGPGRWSSSSRCGTR